MSRLPPFDARATDARFLEELDALLQAGAFGSYREWAAALGVSPSLPSAIAAGRYHCNLALLHETARHYPALNFTYVVFGDRAPKEGPRALPVRRRGRPPKTQTVPKTGTEVL